MTDDIIVSCWQSCVTMTYDLIPNCSQSFVWPWHHTKLLTKYCDHDLWPHTKLLTKYCDHDLWPHIKLLTKYCVTMTYDLIPSCWKRSVWHDLWHNTKLLTKYCDHDLWPHIKLLTKYCVTMTSFQCFVSVKWLIVVSRKVSNFSDIHK